MIPHTTQKLASLPQFLTRMLIRCLVFAALTLAISGCANWKSKELETIRFPQYKMSPDSVALELAVAQIDPQQQVDFDQLWLQLDEQKLALETRKRLDQNGLRAGVLPNQVPTTLCQLIQPQQPNHERLDTWQLQLLDQGKLDPASRLLIHKKVQIRAGEAKDIPSSDFVPESSWVVRNGNLQSVGVGTDVRGTWNLTTHPNGDGSVRLIVTPQLHHGKIRSEIGVAEGGFLFQARQKIQKLQELKFDVTLQPGETLMIAATPDLTDLGELFFTPWITADEVSEAKSPESVSRQAMLWSEQGSQRMLLVRLVHTQMDDLFAVPVTESRLSTVD